MGKFCFLTYWWDMGSRPRFDGLLLKRSLWASVIKAIHGEDGKIGNCSKYGHKSIWRDIVQEMDVFKKQGTNLYSFMQKKLGNDVNTSFWEDVWRENMAFNHRYPRLYALEVNKKVDVAAKLAHASLVCSFRHVPRSGVGHSHLEDLLTDIEGASLAVMNDKWTWALEGSGGFFVASVRKLLDDKRLSVVSSHTRWIKAVPIKVNIHAWKVRLDSLPTRLNISRRCIDIMSILCPIYGSAVESPSHVFFDCQVAKDNFRKICRWWDVVFMEVSSYEEWITWIQNLSVSVKHKRLLECIEEPEFGSGANVYGSRWEYFQRKQDKCPLEIPLDFEEDVFDDEVQRNKAITLSDEKITLDASSEGTLLDKPIESPEKSPVSPNINNASMNEARENDSRGDSIAIDINENNKNTDETESKKESQVVIEVDPNSGEDKRTETYKRSKSTGHSIASNNKRIENDDRFRLRLPQDMQVKLIPRHNWTRSCTEFGEYKTKTSSSNDGFDEEVSYDGYWKMLLEIYMDVTSYQGFKSLIHILYYSLMCSFHKLSVRKFLVLLSW
uniref:RNA-directed DNA polymerase, eukaryota, reverse transcriptase zinc-binding domain protein n=1 Tax=Tanacetum cinerariifolium TaxID=118510 RepID=A0A6L2LXB0_TANCI|nr:RNA-directed DNA polymerase, eukaryota, reverse transcriptase zinc-binding domain protein [Tanacetum cinerariifolium]